MKPMVKNLSIEWCTKWNSDKLRHLKLWFFSHLLCMIVSNDNLQSFEFDQSYSAVCALMMDTCAVWEESNLC